MTRCIKPPSQLAVGRQGGQGNCPLSSTFSGVDEEHLHLLQSLLIFFLLYWLQKEHGRNAEGMGECIGWEWGIVGGYFSRVPWWSWIIVKIIQIWLMLVWIPETPVQISTAVSVCLWYGVDGILNKAPHEKASCLKKFWDRSQNTRVTGVEASQENWFLLTDASFACCRYLWMLNVLLIQDNGFCYLF